MNERPSPTIPALVVALVVLSACSSTTTAPTATPSGTPASGEASATATAKGSATPSAVPASPSPPTSEELGPDSVAQVVTTDLVIRSRPEISDASAILTPTVSSPTLLFIVDGPVPANGYNWYQVQPFGMHYLDFMQGAPPFGWVAASSREGEAWIAPAELDCPEHEIDSLRAMTDIARLACYDADELTLDGQLGGCFVADPAAISPGWLYQSGMFLLPIGYVSGVLPDPGGMPMRMSPDGSGLDASCGDARAVVRVTGHFDDPAATECEPVPGGLVLLDPAQAVLFCRAQFVLTRIERLDG